MCYQFILRVAFKMKVPTWGRIIFICCSSKICLLCSWSHFKLINFKLFFFGNPILKDLSNNPLIWRIIRKLNKLHISNELQQRGSEFKQRRNYLRNFVFFYEFCPLRYLSWKLYLISLKTWSETIVTPTSSVNYFGLAFERITPICWTTFNHHHVHANE